MLVLDVDIPPWKLRLYSKLISKLDIEDRRMDKRPNVVGKWRNQAAGVIGRSKIKCLFRKLKQLRNNTSANILF